MPGILDLPAEILSIVVVYASTHAPTRQKRRVLLLRLATVCRAFNAICMRQIYSKLAYEISAKGSKLLSTLSSSPATNRQASNYAEHVRALAIREREGAPQRKIINSRVHDKANDLPAMTSRARKAALDGTAIEEQKITRLLGIVRKNLVELKYETNLLPTEDDTLANLGNMRNLTLVPQVPFPEAADHEALLRTATFTLSLPPELFKSAFISWKHLRVLDLWRCSFVDIENSPSTEKDNPAFHLDTFIIQECQVTGAGLDWLLKSSLEDGSLRTLKLGFLSGDESTKRAVRGLIQKAGPSLTSFGYFGDEDGLSVPKASSPEAHENGGEHMATQAFRSPLSWLGRLHTLELGGRAITSEHWLAIPRSTLVSLRSIELDYCPSLSPVDVLDMLKLTPLESTALQRVTLKGAEEIRRQNLRSLLYPSETYSDWTWSRMDYVTFVSFASARGIQYVADRAIAVGDEDQSDSEAESLDLQYDDTADFYVTAEQLEEERRIEKEELERTWESGKFPAPPAAT